jgi:hypothetical protein
MAKINYPAEFPEESAGLTTIAHNTEKGAVSKRFASTISVTVS